jgi:multiple sugar transport system permease protein
VQTLLYEFYRETFVKLNANYGSAIVTWSVAVILLFTALQFGFEKKWVHYDN